jgi:predicted RNA-binding protein with PIN domain
LTDRGKQNPIVNFVRILVDGYSVLHACHKALPNTKPHSPKARDWLIRQVTLYQDAIHVPVTIVFDGMGSKASKENQEVHPHVEVLFSKSNQTADDIIERVTHKLLKYGPVLVVTNDYAEQNTIFSMGGSVSSGEQFMDEIQHTLSQFDDDLRKFKGKQRR